MEILGDILIIYGLTLEREQKQSFSLAQRINILLILQQISAQHPQPMKPSSLLLLPIILLLLSSALCFTIHTVTGQCKNLLPYSITSVPQSTYLTWYGKLGDSASGTTYEPGHLFDRHVAISNQCTADQIRDGKTVFINRNEMTRTVVVLDSTNCDLGNTAQFNYRTTKTIASASEYIDGIDCQTNTRKKFSKFYIQYKKTLQNRSPSQGEYMGSQKVTVWTVYPAR